MNYLYGIILKRAKPLCEGKPVSEWESAWFQAANELLAELVEEGLYATAIELEEIIEANQKLKQGS